MIVLENPIGKGSDPDGSLRSAFYFLVTELLLGSIVRFSLAFMTKSSRFLTGLLVLELIGCHIFAVTGQVLDFEWIFLISFVHIVIIVPLVNQVTEIPGIALIPLVFSFCMSPFACFMSGFISGFQPVFVITMNAACLSLCFLILCVTLPKSGWMEIYE